MSYDDHVAGPAAVYDRAAQRYVDFVGTEISAATEAPIDQSLLRAFIELVKRGTRLRVADLGCGPGRVAAMLAANGLEVVGVDVSKAMVAFARAAHPDIAFEEGRLDALPFESGELAGSVCWYSIIYTPPDRLGEVFAELARVVQSGGCLLVAFQAGTGEPVHRARAHGTDLPLTTYLHDVREVTVRLGGAGLAVFATARREPELEHETHPQAFVFARRS